MNDQTTPMPAMPAPEGGPYPAAPPPKKKMSKGKKWAIGVGAFFALGIIGNLTDGDQTPTAAPAAAASSTPSPTSSTQSAEEKAKAEADAKAAAEAQAKAAAEAKAKADAEAKAAAAAAAAEKARIAALTNPKSYTAISDRSFALVAKNPDKYVGKKYVVYGHVTQFDSATGTDTFRADLAGKRKSEWYDYDVNSIVTVDDEALVENVVEDDLVTLYVEVAGSLSYDTQIGGSTTVPQFKAHIIKVTGSTN